MTNLFLYYYENKWLLDTEKRDLHKIRLSSNKVRFIEDLCSRNNDLKLIKNFKNT